MVMNKKIIKRYNGARTVQSFNDFLDNKSVSIQAEHALNEQPKAIVMFYRNGCSHCDIFKPVYESLTKDFYSFTFCLVNGKECPSLKEKYNIKSYPTLMYMENGVLISTFIDTPRNKDTVTTWLKKMVKE
jgi:thioredoxin-related protein